ncbi:MAG: hypothetical protein AMXMBFR61_09310 [Fimbriimonadales bacterium]
MKMVAVTSRFGSIEYQEEDVLTFAEGPYGFPDLRRFVILEHKPGSPFRWLQSLDEPGIAFLIISPTQLFPDYAPSISEESAKSISLTASDPVLVNVVVTIPQGNPEAMTANLAGPIIINPKTREARQIIVEEGQYGTKHSIMDALSALAETAA